MDSNSSSLNGFSINKFSRQLYLNSKYANYTVDTGRNSSCSFVLNEPINIPKGMNAYCSVVSAEIPNTIFSVDQYTNIPITITKIGGGLVSKILYVSVSAATNAILNFRRYIKFICRYAGLVSSNYGQFNSRNNVFCSINNR